MTNTVYRPIADPTGSEANSSDHAECGRRAAASILRTYAEPVGLSIPDGANNFQVADGINAYGHGFHAQATAWNGPKPQEVMAAEIPKGHWVMVAVWCTGDAEPILASQAGSNTPAHWLATYQTNGTCFNCWRQTFPTYSNLDACYHPYGSVIVWHDEKPTPPPPVPKPPAPALPREEDSVLSVTRADGATRDYVDVDAGGTGWHTVTFTDPTGLVTIQNNDRLQGAWLRFLSLTWNHDQSQLVATGRAITGGATFTVTWKGSWGVPIKTP